MFYYRVSPEYNLAVINYIRGRLLFLDTYNIYKDINARTQGEIYIGVVGPVRSGKSTFIKHFAEKLILPFMDEGAGKERTKDELPQPQAGLS